MAEDTKTAKPSKPAKKRAPTLYLIIVGKLLKGLFALALAFGVLKLANKDLPELFNDLMTWVHLDPENKFLSEISDRLNQITAANVRIVALGTFIYSLFSLVEGIGLFFRWSWAGWLAIGESAFFIPIELRELVHRQPFSWFVFSILVVNVFIVWYLYANRHRLFKHH
ncbi:MAG TPA: DUF2127 domain-containing protein [Verrucomicrobiae bacterium]|nr:DUF2127 domain-containing protein [Verrucomicrobiae bacterium]